MGDDAAALFLCAGEEAIPDAKRGFAPAFHHAQARRRLSISFPMFGYGNHLIPVHVHDAEHGHLWHATHFVKGAARRDINQPFIAHVLEQRFQADLFLPAQAKVPCNLSLASRAGGRGDEIEDLLPRGQAGRGGQGMALDGA
jgi:hypothetical protein